GPSSTSFPIAPSLLGELLLGTHSLLHLQDKFLCSRATGDSRTGGDRCGLEIDHPGYIFSALDGRGPTFANRASSQNVIEPPGAIEISPPLKEIMH
ncbi:MAG: hypothetical protein JWQ49_2979, partial [Edaphobacter sp.]|nr:hypothetical protein [Edaphobacter sp.]